MSDDTTVQIVCFEPQLLEVCVPMHSSPNPEAVLFDKIAEYLAKEKHRYPILGINCYYESKNNSIYMTVTLGQKLPLLEIEHATD